MNEIWNINENESILIPERLMCVFDCEGHRPKFVQGLKMRQKKKQYSLHSVRMLDHA